MQLILINENRTVCARELHKFLEVKTRFHDWFTRRVDEYSFESPNDFNILKFENSKEAEYVISLDTAIEILKPIFEKWSTNK